jgi:hypothetical protein
MSIAVLIGYAVGITLGLLAARIDAFGRVWPAIVRTQLLVVSIALSITAVWGISTFATVLWPLLMVGGFVVITVVALVTVRGDHPQQHAVLQAWASASNTGFWSVPLASVLAGPTGALTAVLVDRLGIPLWAWWTHQLRRDAPLAQRRRTSLIDQSPLIALAIGAALRLTGPAPDWAHTITYFAGPVLAATGSAIFIGSVLHPSQRIDPRPGVRRWLTLVSVRVAFFLIVAVVAPTPAIRVVAILLALSIPTFAPPQMATIYGYADPVVAAGSRYGWVFGVLGLTAAVAATYLLV